MCSYLFCCGFKPPYVILYPHQELIITRSGPDVIMRLHPKNKAHNKHAEEPVSFKKMPAADKVTGITLMLMAAIIPLIVKYAELPVGPDQNLLITATEKSIDMFSYYKSVFIFIGSCILLLCLLCYTFSKSMKSLYNWSKMLSSPFSVGFAVFLLAIIASSIFTKYRYTVIYGISERYESVFMLLSYLVIFAAAFLFTRSAFQCRFLVCGLLFSCFIIGLIGTFQFFKMDFFMTETASKLVIGFDTKLRLTSPFTKDHLSYTTLYNPNSVGSYTALMLPITVLGAVYHNRGIVMRIWFAACGMVTLFTAIGCNSSGGLAGSGVSAVVLMITFIYLMYKGNKLTGKKIFIGIFAGLAVIILIVQFIGPVRSRLYLMSYKLLSLDADHFFQDMHVSGGTVDIATANGDIRFVKSDGLIVSIDGNAPLTPVSTDESDINNSVINSFSVPGFGDFIVEEITGAFMFRMIDISFLFCYDEYNNVMPLSKMMKPIDISKPVNAFGFDGAELWGSGRGYIWSRTLPLLAKRWVLGSGPDTYILEFPQDDIVGKVRYLGNPYIIVDKAHNIYLQTGVNTGVPSMLALMFIFAWYIITNLISVLKGPAPNEEKWLFGMRIAIMAGVCGYAVASMTTDSTVSVSPVFWMVLGIGAALQRRLARE